VSDTRDIITKMIKQIFILLSSSLLLISCSHTKMLTRSLQKSKAPISYLHDSEIIEFDKTKTISLGNFNNQIIDSITNVIVTKRIIIPLLVFNYFDRKYDVSLGQSNLDQNYTDFFKNSFIAESHRSGKYSFVDSNVSDYILDIKIDRCNTTSKYQTTITDVYLGDYVMTTVKEKGFPSESKLVLSVKLKSKNKVVFEKDYEFDKTRAFSRLRSSQAYTSRTFFNNNNVIRTFFITNMVETLSLNTKECIELIIDDINKEIN